MRDTPDWKGKTILIVEDEEVNQFFFKTALRITNARLLFAVDGGQGVQLVEQHPDIDCVLMDIRLPLMDGYEATQKIKEMRPGLPVIVQTAYALSNDRAKAIDAGCDLFLSKPIKLDLLFEVLDKYLNN
ncbi:MAG: response regulator [Prolixibacteraceae bacterium]|nr:response regulator [Prolixibacteraceae bacterium]